MLFLGAHQCRQHPSTSQKNGTPGWFLQLLESPLQTLVLLELQWGSKWLLSHPTTELLGISGSSLTKHFKSLWGSPRGRTDPGQ